MTLKDHIVSAKTYTDLQEIFLSIAERAVIFIDVDDTLITPTSKVFHAESPYRFLIDDLKKNRHNVPNFEKVLSHWRLQRQTKLVLEEWPSMIRLWKQKHTVYGLTLMETGSIGDIPSMEKWRYEELAQKDILFTPSFENSFEQTFTKGAQPIAFYHGIFITGTHSKGEVLEIFLKLETPSQVVLIDDREDHLLDVKAVCAQHEIDFLGVLFKGLELIPETPDPKIAEFQKEHLLTHAEWLEDEEAEKEIIFSRA